MSKNLDFKTMSEKIITNLGGKENIANLNHCATRLRVVVKDPTKINQNSLKSITGVMGVEIRDTQVQVIVGTIIEDLFVAVEKVVGSLSSNKKALAKDNEKGTNKILQSFTNFLQLMAGIMSPVIPALIAAGFLTVLLLVMNMFFGLSTTSPTYILLNNLAQSVFYFLPVFVAYTSAKKFDTEPVLAMLLACWLLYPGWVEMASAGGWTNYFGIPVLLTTYNGAVLQIILSVWIMSLIDRLLKKIIPLTVRHFLKPFLLILIISIITITLTGPMGGLITNYIASGIAWLRTNASWLAVPAIIIFASTVGLLCPGFHLALIPIAMTSLATVGYDDFINIWFFCCTITPGFIALAVGLKTKNINLRQIAFPASLSALFGGISEPTVYGISYKMPKIFFASTATSLITAFVAGLMNLKCYGFGGYSITNILLYLGTGNDTANFTNALICVAIMAVCSFVFVWLIKFDDTIYNDESDVMESHKVEIAAPTEGEYIPQESIHDPMMAKGELGKCFGIKPTSELIKAPIAGVVQVVSNTKHAIIIKSDNQDEVMVHIGIDSVYLEGTGLETFVAVGQRVKLGDVIAKFDKEVFQSKNIDDTIITILLNSNTYHDIKLNPNEKAMLVASI